MIGIVLGLGFQWWPNLHEPWQYAAFIFVYFDIADYWIDYSPSLKKFPPKRELDVILDIAIMFLLFLYIYATQLTILYFLTVYAIFSVLDFIWLLRARKEYQLINTDKIYIDSWIRFNVIEVILALGLIGTNIFFNLGPAVIIAIFIILRIAMRILASLQYKRIYFV